MSDKIPLWRVKAHAGWPTDMDMKGDGSAYLLELAGRIWVVEGPDIDPANVDRTRLPPFRPGLL